ncbi:hypothetical protein GCM10010455_27110 [Microbacterium esteraromaticum]
MTRSGAGTASSAAVVTVRSRTGGYWRNGLRNLGLGSSLIVQFYVRAECPLRCVSAAADTLTR